MTANSLFIHEDGRTEFLHLEIDGRETRIEDRAEESAMRQRLELWRQALSAAMVGDGVVDEETLRRLKALGYV